MNNIESLSNKKCTRCDKAKPLSEYRQFFCYERNRMEWKARCSDCENEISIKYYHKMKRVSSICGRCGGPKEANYQYKCKPCINEYNRERNAAIDELRKERPNNLTSLIKYLLKKIELNDGDIDLKDMNNIITYYLYITSNIYEYDNFLFGVQLGKMIIRIREYSITHSDTYKKVYVKRNKNYN